MKFYIVTETETFEKNMDCDDSIKELYDILNTESSKELYFRDKLLEPDKPVKNYFPYDFLNNYCVYLYTKPNYIKNMSDNRIESANTLNNIKNIKLIFVIYLLFLIGITTILKSIYN